MCTGVISEKLRAQTLHLQIIIAQTSSLMMGVERFQNAIEAQYIQVPTTRNIGNSETQSLVFLKKTVDDSISFITKTDACFMIQKINQTGQSQKNQTRCGKFKFSHIPNSTYSNSFQQRQIYMRQRIASCQTKNISRKLCTHPKIGVYHQKRRSAFVQAIPWLYYSSSTT